MYKKFLCKIFMISLFYVSYTNATIWLNKIEAIQLIDILNEGIDNKKDTPLDFKKDIIPLRIKKFGRLNFNLSEYISSLNKHYGMFVNIGDIFKLVDTKSITEECKKKALIFCINAFVGRVQKLGYDFGLCLNDEDIKSATNFESLLLLCDIVFTPVTSNIKEQIGMIFNANKPIVEKTLKILDLMKNNFDLIDRSLLHSYANPFKESGEKCKSALVEIAQLKKIVEKPENTYLCDGIFYTLVSLLTMALKIQHGIKKRSIISFFEGAPLIKKYPIKLWCNCAKVDMFERVFFTAKAAYDFSQSFPPSLHTDINYISWGAGHFLQDFIILSLLGKIGYKKINIHLIDMKYDKANLKRIKIIEDINFLMSVLSKNPETQFAVSLYESSTFFEENFKTTGLPCLLTAVDILCFKNMRNSCFDDFLKNCIKREYSLQIQTLNCHEIEKK